MHKTQKGKSVESRVAEVSPSGLVPPQRKPSENHLQKMLKLLGLGSNPSSPLFRGGIALFPASQRTNSVSQAWLQALRLCSRAALVPLVCLGLLCAVPPDIWDSVPLLMLARKH